MIPKVIGSSTSAALLPKVCPMLYQFCSLAQSCLTLCDPIDCSTPGFPVHHQLLGSWLKFMCIKSVMPSNHLILRCPLLLLPSIFPSIRVFSNESVLRIRWPKYWLTGLISLQSKGLSRVFYNTTVQKHQFFGVQPCLWSNSHIHTWLLEKPWLWLYGPLSAK